MSTLLFGHTIDFQSEHWKAVEAWAAHEIEQARDDLESPHLSERETADLRGVIRGMRRLLSLPSSRRPDGTQPAAASPISYNN